MSAEKWRRFRIRPQRQVEKSFEKLRGWYYGTVSADGMLYVINGVEERYNELLQIAEGLAAELDAANEMAARSVRREQ